MKIRLTLIAVTIVCAAGRPVHAGMFEDVLDGLRFAGFNTGVDHSGVSNSSFAVLGTTFQGNTIDLGDFDLTLAGPVAAVLETGGRDIPTLDLTVSTGALNINAAQNVSVLPAQPLSYNMNIDTGTVETDITGNLLLDARVSVNTFGSYDLKLQYSDRQTTTQRGQFGYSERDNDVDLGPIDIEGNIFADLLATATDPFFQATNSDNIFALFSGRTFREAKSRNLVESLRTRVDSGRSVTQGDVDHVAALSLVASVLGDDFPDFAFISEAVIDATSDATVSGTTAPEPSTVFFLLSCAPVYLLGRRIGRPR